MARKKTLPGPGSSKPVNTKSKITRQTTSTRQTSTRQSSTRKKCGSLVSEDVAEIDARHIGFAKVEEEEQTIHSEPAGSTSTSKAKRPARKAKATGTEGATAAVGKSKAGGNKTKVSVNFNQSLFFECSLISTNIYIGNMHYPQVPYF